MALYSHPTLATEVVASRMPRELALQLADLARENDRTLSSELRRAAREHLKRHEKVLVAPSASA
jgi:hypothetical protein